MSDTPLACPHCGRGDRLVSWESTKVGYPVELYRDRTGVVLADYPGTEAGLPDDEASEYEADLWCRGCDKPVFESELVPQTKTDR